MSYTVKLRNGAEVVCETVAQVHELVGELAGYSDTACAPSATPSATPPGMMLVKKPKTRRKRNYKSPGTGPKKLWGLAMYHSAVTGQTKFYARMELSALKASDRRTFMDKQDEHARFVTWYAERAKMDPDGALESLQILFDDENEKFTALVNEFSKIKMPAGTR